MREYDGSFQIETVTDAIRVSVQSVYLAAESDPGTLRYVFPYFVRIENTGGEPVQLFWRHWRIHDPVGGDQEVEGEGVVGETPLLAPGEAHEYQSFCVLRSPTGHMDGFYHFRRGDGSVFRAPIPRFQLQAPLDATGDYLA
jgi:ApaG protein